MAQCTSCGNKAGMLRDLCQDCENKINIEREIAAGRARAANQAAFEAKVQNLVDTLSQMAPLALAQTKKSLNEIAAGLYNEPALKERSRQSVHTQDFAEGRTAFAERRAPKFTGT